MQRLLIPAVLIVLAGAAQAKFPYPIQKSYWIASNYASAEIQKELKLPAAKIAQVKQIQEAYEAAIQKLDAETGDNPTDAQATEYFKQSDRLDDRYIDQMWSLMTTLERERLEQIRLQQQGAKAFLEPGLSGYLKLTALQIAKLKQIKETAQSEVDQVYRAMIDAKKIDWPELRKVRNASSARVSEQSMKVLTEAQHKLYKAILGKPFERGVKAKQITLNPR